MFVRALAVVLVATGLAACLEERPSEHGRFGPHERWTTTSAQPWIVFTLGCGFCGPLTEEWSDTESLVLYDSGQVLRFAFGSGNESSAPRVNAVAGLEEFRGEVAEVAPLMDYAKGRNLKIHEASTSKVTAVEWARVKPDLEGATAQAEDPGPPRFDCDDCAGRHVQLFAPKPLTVVLHPTMDNPEYGNYRTDDPWGRIAGEGEALRLWVMQWTEPEPDDDQRP